MAIKTQSFVREVLGYEIAGNYMDVSKSNYAKIYVNGSYLGLYANTEAVNSDFQEKFLYANKNETRLKCNPANVQNGGSSLEYLGATESNYYNYYELDSDSGWTDLVNLCNIVDNAPSLLNDYLDIDRAIWMLAYNNVLVNLDSYTGPFKQNYYLIMPKNGSMVPVMWDFNQDFGSFGMINQGSPGGSSALAQMDLLLRQNDNSFPLLYDILQNDTYRKMYLAHCKTIYNEFIENDAYYNEAVALQSIMASDLQADNNAFYTYTQAQSNLTTSVSGGGGPGPGGQSIIGLKELFDARKTYLESTTHFQATEPTISNINAPDNVQTNTTFNIMASVSNANNVMLGYREYAGDRFVKTTMYDDGQHNDGAANDGVYGASVLMNASDLQYYIYAENNDIGKFSPQRAEHEFYSIACYNNIVINEIQAKNNTTQPDQNGEFQDWIELYNNSSQDIDLSNYYLSDKGSLLNRWQFPTGTVISPDEYLIVWADADTFQAGLHANFKLSAGGESVYLSDGTTVFQKLKYQYFDADTSFARHVNGTGAFSLSSPTFKANNDGGGTGIFNVETKNPSFTIYPNPTQHSFYISSKNESNLVRIYNLQGQVIFKEKIASNQAISTQNWSNGVYFVQIDNSTQKLIINK